METAESGTATEDVGAQPGPEPAGRRTTAAERLREWREPLLIAVASLLGTPSWWQNRHAGEQVVGFSSIVNTLTTAHVLWVLPIAIAMLVLLAIGARWLVRQGLLPMAIFCAACLGSTMLDIVDSMPRLMGIAFPAFAALAAIVVDTRQRRALLGFFTASQVVLAGGTVARLAVP